MNSKKVAGIAVIKNSADDAVMQGRVISDSEKQALLDQFRDRFQTPTLVGANYTIGKLKSDSGIGFRELPEKVIFGVILTDPTNDCEFLVYAEAELAAAMPVIDALGGLSTFTEDVVHFGNTYAANYSGGSAQWDPLCL